jgi:hypothetical protein
MKLRIRMASSHSGAFAKRWFLGGKIQNGEEECWTTSIILRRASSYFLFYITALFQIWEGEVTTVKEMIYVCITRLVLTTKLS